MGKSPTIGIIGATIWGNRGAEAMLVTTIGQMRSRFPDAKFVVFSYTPKQDRALINDPQVTVAAAKPAQLVLAHFPFALISWVIGLVGLSLPDGLLPKTTRALRSCDVLLDISGISFADGREKFLPFNILNQWPASLFKVPVVRMSQAMGTFKHPLTRTISKIFMPRAERIYARGKTTASFLEELKLNPKKWELSADIAFLYRPEYTLSTENEPRIADLLTTLEGLKAQGKSIVGIAPSALVYQKSEKKGRDYVGQLLRLISQLGADQHVVLVPNATREHSTSVNNNDLYVIEFVRQRAEKELGQDVAQRIHAINYDMNTSGSRRVIALCDVLITSRFHGMISGLSLGIPTAVIGWSHKYAEVLAEFDMEHFAIDFDDPNLNITELLDTLLSDQATLQQQLKTSLDKVQALSTRQFDFVETLLS